jgi:general secretion pathway protein D
VYDVQNGKADELAKSLAQVLSLSYSETTSSSLNSTSQAGGSTLGLSQGSSNTGGGNTYGSGSGYGSAAGSGTAAGSGYGSSASFGSGYGSGSSATSGYDDRTGGAARSGTPSRTGSPNVGGGNSGMSIAPNVESNSLMILATPSEFAMVEAALKHLDVPPLEVMIEATLAEVTLTDQLRFGLQWSYQTKQGPATFSESSTGAIAQQFPGLSFLYTGNSSISAVLSSLETMTKVKVLSSPKLLVLNNREAELKIGDQVPVITQSAVSTVTSNSAIVNSVELMDTGVILRVIPRVNKNGLVTLEVSQQVSDVGATTTSSINSPTIHQREMSSTVEVRNGETIALGGLISESVTNGRDGLPFLSRIPVLGSLFGSTSHEKDRTELIVLLTPHVLRSSEESAELMEDLRSQFTALRKQIPISPARSASQAEPSEKKSP